MARGAAVALAVSFALCGCSDPADQVAWPGSVEAEVDNLTGQRSGLFRTYGPTENLVAGRDTIPVTVGYWCRVDQMSEPPWHRDGLFFRISLPDTSLLVDEEEAFEELRGQFGLLDAARMAVDGRVYAWEYRPQATVGGWYLEGQTSLEPPRFGTTYATQEVRDGLLELAVVYHDSYLRTLGYDDRRMRAEGERARNEFGRLETVVREGWQPAHDYAAAHYFGRDTVGIEFKGVVEFPLVGLAAAADSVRFWCPVVESQLAWNRLRSDFVGRMDSLRLFAEDQTRIAEAEAENRRQAAAQRAAAQAEAERIAEAEAESRRQAAAQRAAVQAEAERVGRELLERRMSLAESRGSIRLDAPLRIRVATSFLQAARELGVARIRSEEDIERVCRRWRVEGGPSLSSPVTVPFGRVMRQHVCLIPERRMH